jgi:hypothetical protein
MRQVNVFLRTVESLVHKAVDAFLIVDVIRQHLLTKVVQVGNQLRQCIIASCFRFFDLQAGNDIQVQVIG